MEKLVSKRNIAVVILIVIALVSVLGISKIASSPEFHAENIQYLDDKKIMVLELAAATAGVSTALALIPSDVTNPLADQILELSSYLIIVIGAIYLEKILLTLTGYAAFTFLIPIACLLYGIYLFVNKDILRNLAIKLGVFGLAIFMIVPISVQVSNLIEDTHQVSINQTIEEAKNMKNEAEAEATTTQASESTGIWEGFVSKVEGVISNITDGVQGWIEKGKNLLSNFIDAIAMLLITSCVIPIVILIFFVWIIKLIFNINIPIENIKKINFKKEKKD